MGTDGANPPLDLNVLNSLEPSNLDKEANGSRAYITAAMKQENGKYGGPLPAIYAPLRLAVSTSGTPGSDT